MEKAAPLSSVVTDPSSGLSCAHAYIVVTFHPVEKVKYFQKFLRS